MKARPILFQGDMVRAILDGRKTQTRRVVKPQPQQDPSFYGGWVIEDAKISVAIDTFNETSGGMLPGDPTPCPYGKPGDLLWVRESFTYVGTWDPGFLTYRATYPNDLPSDVENVPEDLRGTGYRWRPSIHMPRRISRLTLRIARVRLERLQEISEADAQSEGVAVTSHWRNVVAANPTRAGNARYAFSLLWESINGPDAWIANPWVWVIEFEPIQANVDQVLEAAA